MKAEDRKRHILGAALKAFAENGYERTSIAVICREAGIARPTLYQYFNDKRSVFRELLETSLRGMHSRVHQRQKTRANGRTLSRLEELTSTHRELIEELSAHRDLYKILLKEAKARNTETEDIVNGYMNALMDVLKEEMISEPGAESMNEKDREFAVVYMLGGLMQAVEYYLLGKEHTMSKQELADRITLIELKIKGD